ncbi:hypothetical protein Phum_PHUM598030 [Pediculus humanus corporis]|uniref:Uncharacterized protein n=1 Tax=Pediculus humanus subsp. corporis TaxID=121224 RepID=E0W2W1_PEDHC|nr:uncharacterized protein Phum_PHUM598030 [Pediculus humanus corporis]EEB19967.1 hypothetical protein Phum_PHUM598030 [Pediculus humanus corporis]
MTNTLSPCVVRNTNEEKVGGGGRVVYGGKDKKKGLSAVWLFVSLYVPLGCEEEARLEA